MESKKIKLLTTIIDRGQGEKVIEVCEKHKVSFNLLLHGKGTASSEMLDYLGIGETKKDVVVSFVRENNIQKILNVFKIQLKLNQPGTGIAFTIPLAKISTLLNKVCPVDEKEVTKQKVGESMDRQFGLVAAVVNHGNVDLVMEHAKQAGARGGTVINARAVLNQDLDKFFGIAIHPEKDILLIITKKEDELNIMKAINEVSFDEKEDHIIVLSMPVSELIGLRQQIEAEVEN